MFVAAATRTAGSPGSPVGEIPAADGEAVEDMVEGNEWGEFESDPLDPFAGEFCDCDVCLMMGGCWIRYLKVADFGEDFSLSITSGSVVL